MRSIILLYHRISVERDVYKLAVDPTRFADHLSILSELVNLVPLTEFGQTPSPSVAITFDDGYLDNLLFAKPTLRDSGAPATVFVVSGKVGSSREFWWHELERIILDTEPFPDHLEKLVRGKDVWIDTRTRPGRERACHALRTRFTGVPTDEIERELDQLRLEVGALSSDAPRRVLTAAELRQLADGGLVTIGAHTESHPLLDALPTRQRREEIVRSRDALAAIVGPISAFAYPFGRCSDETVALVREAGFELACDTAGTAGEVVDPYRLPRHLVEDWPADEFRSRLMGWLEL